MKNLTQKSNNLSSSRETTDDMGLSKEEKLMLNLFKTMDTDNSNALTKHELKAGFEKGGAKLNDDYLEKMFLFVDKDNSGSISYEEFREYLMMKKKKSKKLNNKKSQKTLQVRLRPNLKKFTQRKNSTLRLRESLKT